MAWIEDPANGVLLVHQSSGLKFWTFPGGKVKRGESLVKALRQEVEEETGLRVQVGSLLGYWIGETKMLSRFSLPRFQTKSRARQSCTIRRLKKAIFQMSLPNKSSPSAKYFWSARRGPVKKTPKIRASTHQFPPIW